MTELLDRPVLEPLTVETVPVEHLAPEVPVPEPLIVGSLSPSRAADFRTCPLLYRFRSIDRLPEEPSRAATRGTVVHAVLDGLFDLAPADRTVQAAQDAVTPAWEQLLAAAPELAGLFAEQPDELAEWLASARQLLVNYFQLEDPTRLEPVEREQLVETVIDGLRLRGYVDRLDVSATGDLRVVDYKTGSTPREAFEGKALFQLKFYALVLWQLRGVVPKQLRLIYLTDTDTLTYSPDAAELRRFQQTLQAIWKAIETASSTGDFQPNPSRLCDWCSHQALCPAKGGTPPPFPFEAVAASAADRRQPASAVAADHQESAAGR